MPPDSRRFPAPQGRERPLGTRPAPSGGARPAGGLAPRPPAAGRPFAVEATRSIEPLIAGFEKSLELLRVEFEKFMNGAVKLPPEELQAELAAEMKRLRNLTLKTAADQFRLSGVEARYNSFSELLNRRLRRREEGRGERPAVVARPAEPRRPVPPDPESGIAVGERLDPAAAHALYQALATQGATPQLDLAGFTGYLEQQLHSIRSKTGCSTVQFRVAREDGRLKLKARPLAGGDGGGR